MKKIASHSILIISIFLIASCTFNNISINRPSDNVDGKSFLNKFYLYVADTSFSDINAMVSDSLKKIAGNYGVINIVKDIHKKAGNYKSYVIDDYYIRAVIGSTNQISYNYKLKVTYAKGVIVELIGLRSTNASGIKLFSYHAYSDLLIH